MKNKLLSTIISLGFITIGLISTIIGPLLLTIKKDISMDYFLSGIILSGQFFGTTIAVLSTGYFADRYGKKKYLLVGSLFLILGLIGSSLAGSYIILLLGLIIIGFGFGIYDIGLNTICLDHIKDYTKEKQVGLLNFLQFFYGIGAICGPILVMFCIHFLNNWRIIFIIIAIFPFIVNTLLLFFKYSYDIPPVLNINVKSLFKNINIWIFGILAFFYVGIEVSIYGWIPSYYEKSFINLLINPAITATLFWIFLSLGRLFLSKTINKIGVKKYIMLSVIIIVILSLVWFFFLNNILTLIIIALLGLALSCIFPSIITLSSKEYPSNTGIINSIIFTFASFGGFLIPSGIGKVLDLLSMNIFPFSIFILSIFLMIISLFIYKKFR